MDKIEDIARKTWKGIGEMKRMARNMEYWRKWIEAVPKVVPTLQGRRERGVRSRVTRLGDISPFGLRKTEFCDIYLMKCDYRHLGDICHETRDILAI